jgi:hypothetical protein
MPLQMLPVEIRDTILGYTTLRLFQPARLSCLLAIGKSTWLNYGTERHSRDLEWPFEKGIWFDRRPRGFLYTLRILMSPLFSSIGTLSFCDY